MKPIFDRGSSLQLRLFLALVISSALVFADVRLDAFSQVRYVLNSAISPMQYVANMPQALLENALKQFSSHQQTLTQNEALKQQLLEQKSNVLLLKHLEQENQRLRDLLGSPFVRDERKMVAEVMAIDSDPYKHQVMIDKGQTNGVYEGQPVINEKGIVGQVSHVGAHNSRVLLLTDITHAIPVQVVRNDIRVIVSGSGALNQLELDNIPSNMDIRHGDVLVTSGLGGVYPEGYPVAEVSSFSFDNRQPFAQVIAKPYVQFDRLRHLLLVWPTNINEKQRDELTELQIISTKQSSISTEGL